MKPPLSGQCSEARLGYRFRIQLGRVFLRGCLYLVGFADEGEDEIIEREVLLDYALSVGERHGVELGVIVVHVALVEAVELELREGRRELIGGLDARRHHALYVRFGRIEILLRNPFFVQGPEHPERAVDGLFGLRVLREGRDDERPPDLPLAEIRARAVAQARLDAELRVEHRGEPAAEQGVDYVYVDAVGLRPV